MGRAAQRTVRQRGRSVFVAVLRDGEGVPPATIDEEFGADVDAALEQVRRLFAVWAERDFHEQVAAKRAAFGKAEDLFSRLSREPSGYSRLRLALREKAEFEAILQAGANAPLDPLNAALSRVGNQVAELLAADATALYAERWPEWKRQLDTRRDHFPFRSPSPGRGVTVLEFEDVEELMKQPSLEEIAEVVYPALPGVEEGCPYRVEVAGDSQFRATVELGRFLGFLGGPSTPGVRLAGGIDRDTEVPVNWRLTVAVSAGMEPETCDQDFSIPVFSLGGKEHWPRLPNRANDAPTEVFLSSRTLDGEWVSEPEQWIRKKEWGLGIDAETRWASFLVFVYENRIARPGSDSRLTDATRSRFEDDDPLWLGVDFVYRGEQGRGIGKRTESPGQVGEVVFALGTDPPLPQRLPFDYDD